ncbi:MAG: sigma factor [Verrucomicrobiota bacterium]
MDTDLALLTRYHRQRDAQAFQTLVESHAAMVHATARRVTQDAALAQDAAQETFLALARSSGSAIHCVGAWLHQAAWPRTLFGARSSCRRSERTPLLRVTLMAQVTTR